MLIFGRFKQDLQAARSPATAGRLGGVVLREGKSWEMEMLWGPRKD